MSSLNSTEKAGSLIGLRVAFYDYLEYNKGGSRIRVQDFAYLGHVSYFYPNNSGITQAIKVRTLEGKTYYFGQTENLNSRCWARLIEDPEGKYVVSGKSPPYIADIQG